ncbi:ATP-binding protein [Candidatus Bathyarchaeota archaeon]|nr:ATP-binding protein [Candidatus Bathyarchaeota archaeon]
MHQNRIHEIMNEFESRKFMYGDILIQSAIIKRNNGWLNIVTKILPLHRSKEGTENEMNYEDFVFIEEILSADKFKEVVKCLLENDLAKITIGNYKIEFEKGVFYQKHFYDSGVDYLGIGWPFNKYHYRPHSQPAYQIKPLVSTRLPLFPDIRYAIKEIMKVDLARHDDYGVIICLPDYRARIKEVKIGATELSISVEALEIDEENILGKLYCERNGKVKQDDIDFTNVSGYATIGFKPDYVHIALISKIDNEMLDERRFGLGWSSLPLGVVIEIPDYEIRELIKHGESEIVEFKEKIGKPEEFAETVIAFANTKGGIILLGVDDHAKIVGVTDPNLEQTINNILRSHCEPPVKYSVEKRTLDEKDVVIIRVEEGKDKPYIVRNKGPYVRTNATDRLATRYELDEFYREKQSTIIRPL